MRFAGTLVALLLLGGCAGEHEPNAGGPPAAGGDVDPYAECGRPGATEDCQSRVEQELLARSGGTVRRSMDTLWIDTSSGASIPLVNSAPDGARYLGYVYVGSAPEIGVEVVRVSFYEGGTYTLVDRETGNETSVFSPPIVAPGAERFATAALDLVAGYGPNGLQVWQVTPYGPRLEWSLEGGESWGASEVRWLNLTELEFTKHTVVPGEADPTRERMRLTLEDGGIRVIPTAEPHE